MSDRVVVMNHGEIRQIGTPEEVYTRPSDSFVANFVGEVNLWHVTIDGRAGDFADVTTSGGARFSAEYTCQTTDSIEAPIVAVRPERVWVWKHDASPPRPEIEHVGVGVITESTFLGNSRSVVISSEQLGRVSALLYDGEEPRHVGAQVAFGWESRHGRVLPE